VKEGSVPKWQRTRLWTELEGRSGEPSERVARAVGAVLNEVEPILASGDSAPGSFTLHDAEHSRRVAEGMHELAGAEVIERCGPYDLGLLLLSAYLHDIGMTPPVARVNSIFDFLISGDGVLLEKDALEDLQAWLDDEAPDVVPPLAGGQPTRATLRQARYLVAQYVRSRHNEWSAAWMKEHLAELDKQTYDGCLFDLTLLCKSHHFGIDFLRSNKFEPRLVGSSPATVLHLRYDACLLRVADVLDFDPERTPKILYEHRSVEDSSAIFWHKDHAMSFAQEGGRLSIDARPPDAITHHAVELTVADVDRELQLVRQLADETPFEHRATGEESLPHRWQMETRVHKNIKPRDDSYVFMDGTFRPDQERILELLGGVALYGSPLAAVRELLQNAFDAVKEQIAYQRLLHDEPAAQSTYDQFAATHRIALQLEQSEEGVRLTCRDTGVGMSREIIESRFLVSGSGTSHETKALERLCEAKGFSLGRTARFGIGVLAYFLLGARLKITTRRSPSANGGDTSGWSFVSHGLTDFGELRSETTCPSGTDVELLIRPDAMPRGVERFTKDLDRYLRRTVRRVPCRFTFTAPGSEVEPFFSEPGWVERSSEIKRDLVAGLSMQAQRHDRDDPELYSSDHRSRIEQRDQRWAAAKKDALEVMRLAEERGELPNGMGSFRLSVGNFRIEEETLLLYLDFENREDGALELKPIEHVVAVQPGHSLSMSWNGMAVESAEDRNERPIEGLCMEIDWTNDSAGELRVDRASILLGPEAEEAIRFVRQKGRSLRTRLARESEKSLFALVNARAVQVVPESIEDLRWPQAAPGKDPRKTLATCLLPLELPAVDLSEYESFDLSQAKWRGADVSAVPPIVVLSGSYGARMHWLWHSDLFAPQAVGLRKQRGGPGPFLIWTAVEPGSGRQKDPFGFVVDFPPSWPQLIRVTSDTADHGQATRVWNSEHPLLRTVDGPSWSWAAETFAKSADPVPHAGDLSQSPARTAAWMLRCIQGRREGIWNGLTERAPELLAEAWNVVGLDQGAEILDWEEDFGEIVLRRISPSSWEEVSFTAARELFLELLGDPGDDWWLTAADGTRDLPLWDFG
jgi:histidine kinase/DNA gyrase B/HSP90-like ATPase